MTIDPATDPADAFDAAFRAAAPALGCRGEEDADRAFLDDLFMACSPLTGVLPAPMLHHQAEIRYAAYRGGFPRAMRRIVTRDGVPVGRIIIDWQPHDTPQDTHCVDIAVLPDARATRAGPMLLAAWLAVADARGLTARLEVDAGNPALRLYTRLGFVADADQDPYDPIVTMHRPVPSTSR